MYQRGPCTSDHEPDTTILEARVVSHRLYISNVITVTTKVLGGFIRYRPRPTGLLLVFHTLQKRWAITSRPSLFGSDEAQKCRGSYVISLPKHTQSQVNIGKRKEERDYRRSPYVAANLGGPRLSLCCAAGSSGFISNNMPSYILPRKSYLVQDPSLNIRVIGLP